MKIGPCSSLVREDATRHAPDDKKRRHCCQDGGLRDHVPRERIHCALQVNSAPLALPAPPAASIVPCTTAHCHSTCQAILISNVHLTTPLAAPLRLSSTAVAKWSINPQSEKERGLAKRTGALGQDHENQGGAQAPPQGAVGKRQLHQVGQHV